jgi:hypothetical protein
MQKIFYTFAVPIFSNSYKCSNNHLMVVERETREQILPFTLLEQEIPHNLFSRVNNQPSGYLDFDPSTATTAFGYQSLLKNSSVNNTAFGYRTLSANTIGQYNTSVGSYSLSLNTNRLRQYGSRGAQVLVQNTTGSFNTAIGENALIGNTSGEANIGVGNQTLAQNKTGTDNVAVGSLALYFNTASFNTALGSNALYDNTTGHDNAATGYILCIAT